jgi:hypothetical protein
MLWMMCAAMLTGYCASACLLVLGAADLTAKRWQRAIGELIGGLVGFAAGVIVIGGAAAVLSSTTENFEERARLTGHIAQTEMTWAAVGFVAGVALGAFLATRRRKAEQAAG